MTITKCRPIALAAGPRGKVGTAVPEVQSTYKQVAIPYLDRRNVAGAKVGVVVTIQCRVGAGTTNRLSKSSALTMGQYIHSTIFAIATL
jgi:hypothetical protein